MKSNSHLYKIKYEMRIERKKDGFSREELEDKGGTDALIWCSLLYPKDGSFSVAWSSADGRKEGNERLDSREIFKAWMLLASQLKEDKNLHEWQRFTANEAHDTFVKYLNLNDDKIIPFEKK